MPIDPLKARAIFKLMAALARGEKVSPYTLARSYADFLLGDIIQALDKGVPRSVVIGALAVSAGCERDVASDVLWRVLKKAEYIPSGPANKLG
ncbi:MAG: hypothetical protein ACYCZR_00635 [Burkholderiales bacterium]